MKRFRIVHNSEYRFDQPVSDCRIALKMRPRRTQGQVCTFFQAITRPPSAEQHESLDPFGNGVTKLRIQGSAQRLIISAISTVTREAPLKEERRDAKSELRANRETADHPSILPFRMPTGLTSPSSQIVAYARTIEVPDTPLLSAAGLCSRIHADLSFMPGSTSVSTRADEVLSLGNGVCQDFAHLAIACLRTLGVPARYVSGYLHTAAFRKEPHRIASDVSHAWFEVFDPQNGWTGFDPTNNRRVDENYIIAAWGRDYEDVRPLQGTFEGGGTHSLHVSVDVAQENQADVCASVDR